MSIEEALEILELNPENYDLSIARKNYLLLLRKYHPDNNSYFASEERTKKICEAYGVVKDKIKSEKLEDSSKILEKDYGIESQLPILPIDNLPIKIRNTIEEYYKKYLILYKSEKMKSYNFPYNLKEYEKKI